MLLQFYGTACFNSVIILKKLVRVYNSGFNNDILPLTMDRLIETAGKNVVKFGAYDVAQAEPLKDSMALAEANPELILKTFAMYDMIIKDLFALTDDELKIIEQVNDKLQKTRGAHEFLKNMDTHKHEILNVVRHAGNLMDAKNQKGVAELAAMMGNAWTIKQTEPDWKPTDGHKRADTVIWGFVNDAKDPRTDIDFAILHGIERIETQHFQDKGIDYTHHKDWLITAMEDIVALRGLQGKYPETKVIDLWTQGRPNGLGWINEKKLSAYKKLLGINK